MKSDDEAPFFESPAAWRRWLARNHTKATEVWGGFHETKTASAAAGRSGRSTRADGKKPEKADA